MVPKFYLKEMHAPVDIQPAANAGVAIRYVTWVGIWVNIGLSILKLSIGWWGDSRALVADGFESGVDVFTSLALVIGSHYWLQPPDKDHPYGHRRIETIITLGIGLAVGAAGLGITWDAIQALRLGSHNLPHISVVVVAAISVISKEILYQWTVRRGKSLRSMSVIANAWHHRSDAISSIPVLLSVSVSVIWPDWTFMDAIGAAVVAAFIIKASVDIMKPAIREMTDVGAPDHITEKIHSIAVGTPGVLDIHDIRTRYVGSSIQADMHVVVPHTITVGEGHQIAEAVMNRVLEMGPDVFDVLIHIDPWDDSKSPDEFKKIPPPKAVTE